LLQYRLDIALSSKQLRGAGLFVSLPAFSIEIIFMVEDQNQNRSNEISDREYSTGVALIKR
jgi:hypothetical protein